MAQKHDVILSKRALCVALSMALSMGVHASASAQTTDASPAQKQADTGIQDTSAKTDAPSGLEVVPELSTGVSYDSNVYATPNQPQGDMLLTVSPGLRLRKRGDGRSLTVDMSGTETRYRQKSSENSTDYRIDAIGRQRVNTYGYLFGGLGFAQLHEDRTSPDDVLGTRPTVFTDARAHLGLAQRWSSVSLRVGSTFDHLTYRNVSNAAGATINNADRNRDVIGVGVRLGYTVSPHLDLFTQGTYDERNYQHEVDDYGYRRDSQGNSWVVGVASRDTRSLRGEVYLGWLSQHYVDPRLPRNSAPTVGATLLWKATPKTTLDATIDRSVQETTLPGASSYIDTSIGLHLNRQLSNRLYAHAGIDVTRNDFRGIDRRDDIYGTTFGVSYRIRRFLQVDANYRLMERHSNVAVADYYRNEIYLGVRMDGGAGAIASDALSASTTDWSTFADGFYVGAATGRGDIDSRVTGMRGEHGTYRSDFAGSGVANSVFAGYGWSFNRWYVGVEATVARTRIDWLHDKTPSSNVFSTDQTRNDEVAVLAGPMLPGNNLLFASAGRLRSRFESAYTVADGTRSSQSDTRWGNAYGVGLEVPLTRHLFARERYEVSHYNGYDVAYEGGSDRFADSVGHFQFGLDWRFGAVPDDARIKTEVSGFYAGAQGGDNRFGSTFDAVQRQPDAPQVATFHSDFGGRGTDFGAFAGYGHAFGPLYAGVEIEGNASDTGWYHEKQPGGREFSVEGRGSYGASIRLGYATHYGSLLYLRAGRARSRFHTVYIKGQNPDAWVDRNDTRTGTRFGIGMEAPLSKAMFVRMDYAVTRYDAIAFTTTHGQADDLRFSNWQHVLHLGVGVRF